MLAEADESPRLTNSKPVLGPLLQAGRKVRIRLPPAVSPANFDVARAGDGYPQIGRAISTVEIPGGRSRCCSSGSCLPSSVSTYRAKQDSPNVAARSCKKPSVAHGRYR